jgi:hypothetical protein
MRQQSAGLAVMRYCYCCHRPGGFDNRSHLRLGHLEQVSGWLLLLVLPAEKNIGFLPPGKICWDRNGGVAAQAFKLGRVPTSASLEIAAESVAAIAFVLFC